MTGSEFEKALMMADPGDWIEYHRGFSCIDRLTGRRTEAAQRAWMAYCEGLVVLTQKRIGSDVFAYMAQVK